MIGLVLSPGDTGHITRDSTHVSDFGLTGRYGEGVALDAVELRPTAEV